MAPARERGGSARWRRRRRSTPMSTAPGSALPSSSSSKGRRRRRKTSMRRLDSILLNQTPHLMVKFQQKVFNSHRQLFRVIYKFTEHQNDSQTKRNLKLRTSLAWEEIGGGLRQ